MRPPYKPPTRPVPDPYTAACAVAVRRLLRAQPAEQTYAIVDTAVDDRLYGWLQLEPPRSEVTCLYDGDPAVRYARYAPYLMRLHEHSPLLRQWFERGWQQHWGIWCTSAQEPAPLKRHFKRFLTLKQEGRLAYLRYYDPRVLMTLLPALNPGHLSDFFGAEVIGRYGACRPDGQLWVASAVRPSWLHQTFGAAKLVSALHPLR